MLLTDVKKRILLNLASGMEQTKENSHGA